MAVSGIHTGNPLVFLKPLNQVENVCCFKLCCKLCLFFVIPSKILQTVRAPGQRQAAGIEVWLFVLFFAPFLLCVCPSLVKLYTNYMVVKYLSTDLFNCFLMAARLNSMRLSQAVRSIPSREASAI